MPSRVGQDTVDQEDDYPDESSHSLGSFGEAIGGRFSVTDRRLVASTRVHDISDEDTVYTALFTAGYYTLDRSATTESAVTEVDIRERGTYHDELVGPFRWPLRVTKGEAKGTATFVSTTEQAITDIDHESDIYYTGEDPVGIDDRTVVLSNSITSDGNQQKFSLAYDGPDETWTRSTASYLLDNSASYEEKSHADGRQGRRLLIDRDEKYYPHEGTPHGWVEEVEHRWQSDIEPNDIGDIWGGDPGHTTIQTTAPHDPFAGENPESRSPMTMAEPGSDGGADIPVGISIVGDVSELAVRDAFALARRYSDIVGSISWAQLQYAYARRNQGPVAAERMWGSKIAALEKERDIVAHIFDSMGYNDITFAFRGTEWGYAGQVRVPASEVNIFRGIDDLAQYGYWAARIHRGVRGPESEFGPTLVVGFGFAGFIRGGVAVAITEAAEEATGVPISALKGKFGRARGGPGRFEQVVESMSDRAAKYQSRITKRLPDVNYVVNGVKFDGYDEVAGVLLEAKGPGYSKFLKDGDFQKWFYGQDGLFDQAQRQVKAANGIPIQWHVAEEDFANKLRELFQGLPIEIIHTPNP